MSAVADKGQRVELGGALAGYYVRVDVDQLDCGLVEDLESRQVTKILDVLARLLVGGDLPNGHTRDALRKLKPNQMTALVDIIPGLFDIPKPA